MKVLDKPAELRDMEAVYSGKEPKTPGELRVAELMKDSFPRFVELLGKVRKDWEGRCRVHQDRKALKAAAGESAGGEVDLGAEKSRELLLKLIGECKE